MPKRTSTSGSELFIVDNRDQDWKVPSVLGKMMQDKDAGKAERVMKAMLQMKKIDIKTLKQAYAPEEQG
jgi:hypothetical protein